MSIFDTQPLELNVSITGHSKLDFDKRKVRKALRQQGAAIRKIARRMVARRAVSAAGDYPGKESGDLARSISIKAGKGGFWVKVAPFKTPEMGKDFYPAYLWYGSKKNNLAPRRNYMIDALNNRRSAARAALRDALEGSIVPRA